MKKFLFLTILVFLFSLTGCSPPAGVSYSGVQQLRRDQEPRSSSWHNGHTVSSARRKVLSTAKSCIGTKYRLGGTDRRGFDCSGLVLYSYRGTGRNLPRTAREQYTKGRRISLSGMKPGDLVFFNFGRGISHVGIYKGKGIFIHAPSTGGRVREDSLNNDYWRKRVAGAVSYL